MTDNIHSDDSIRDLDAERVRRAYRELDAARTPAQLDDAVLALAARERSLPRAGWLRPLSIAATLMLAVAMVVELASVPLPEADTAVTDDTDIRPAATRATDNKEQRLDKAQPVSPVPADMNLPAAASAIAGKAESARHRRALSPPLTKEAESPAERTYAASQCTADERQSPALWWQCVTRMQTAGYHDDAARELDDLRQRFPEFTPPAN